MPKTVLVQVASRVVGGPSLPFQPMATQVRRAPEVFTAGPYATLGGIFQGVLNVPVPALTSNVPVQVSGKITLFSSTFPSPFSLVQGTVGYVRADAALLTLPALPIIVSMSSAVFVYGANNTTLTTGLIPGVVYNQPSVLFGATVVSIGAGSPSFTLSAIITAILVGAAIPAAGASQTQLTS